MYKSLYNIISNMSGFVLAIGTDEKIEKRLKNNELIIKCDLLNSFSKENNQKRKVKTKTINIKKLRKIYKKKKVDYIICNYEQISKYLKNFIKDSVYINKTKLYFYGEIDKNIIKKYERYNTNISLKEYKNTCIIEIDNTNSKTNFIKDLKYGIIDGFNSAIEYIGDILMG